MRVNSSTRFAAMAALFGALACAGNTARTSDTDESAAARDTTTSDSVPPGYRGMERDTTMTPSTNQEPVDTFLQNQGTGQAQDTAGYSGMERQDTTGQQNQQSQMDTTGASQQSQMDTTGASAGGASSSDTSAAGQSSGQTALDSTGQSTTGDTTGYDQSQQQNQQQSDTTTSR
jgi:hypothetical protein